MSDMIPLEYRDFYDIPRMFILSFNDQTYLFDCPFDDASDAYPDRYSIYLMPNLNAEDLAGLWDGLASRAISKVGEVSTDQVKFDRSLRSSVDSEIVSHLDGSSR